MLGRSNIFNSLLNTFPYHSYRFVRNSGSLESVKVILKQDVKPRSSSSLSGHLFVWFRFAFLHTASLKFVFLTVREFFSGIFSVPYAMDPNTGKADAQHDEDAYLELPKPHQLGGVDEYVPDTPEERKLVRKIDLYLLPAIWGMYLLSYMDRTK